jgi:hypothetical protein
MDYQQRRLAIRENNEMVNALRLRYKKEQATYVADRLGKYIRKI